MLCTRLIVPLHWLYLYIVYLRICVFTFLCICIFVSCLHLLRWLACHALYPIDRPVGLWLYFGTICTKSSSDCHQDRLYNLYQGDQMVSLIGTSTTNGFLLAIRHFFLEKLLNFCGKFPPPAHLAVLCRLFCDGLEGFEEEWTGIAVGIFKGS